MLSLAQSAVDEFQENCTAELKQMSNLKQGSC